MSKHFLGCKPQLLGVRQVAHLANTPGLKRRGWGEEKTISYHLSITSFSAYNNLFYRRGSWDWEKLPGPYGKLMPRSSGLQSCALTCHSSWEERKHMSLCCITSTVLLAPPPGVGQYLGQFPCSLGASLIKACKSFNNEFKARDHVILFLGTNSELGWVHYYLSLAQCLRSIGSPQDNLGAGLRLSLSGLFTASEVVKRPEFISACLVLDAKQIPEWGASGESNTAAENLLLHLTTVMLAVTVENNWKVILPKFLY